MNTLQKKIEKLLKKKKVTAHDIGDMLIDTYRAICVREEQQINPADFSELERRFYKAATEKDKTLYDAYKNLYYQIIQTHKKAMEQGEAFITSLMADKVLNEFIENEERHSKAQQIPVIMEAVEYRKLVEAAKTATRERPAAAYYFMLKFIQWKEDETPDKAINNAVRRYKKKSPALNKRHGSALLQPIYRLNGKDFTSLQDPIFIEAKTARARELTGSEDLTAYETYIKDKKKELFYQGAAATRDYMKRASGKRLMNLSDEVLLERLENTIRMTPDIEYIDPENIEIESALMLNPPVEYVGTEPDTYIKGRSCFDLLCLYSDELTDDLPQQIREDYPEIAAAIDKYLEEETATGFPTLPDFYIANISGAYSSRPDILERINDSGIAILNKPYPKQEGKYIFLDYDYQKASKETEGERLSIFRPVAYMNCFNALMELVAQVFDVPELLDFITVKLPSYEKYRTLFNRALYSVNFGLRYFYPAEQLQQRRETLRGLFPYGYLRPLEDFQPSKKSIKEVREYLTELRDTGDPAGHLRLLEYRYLDPLLKSINFE